MTSQNRSKKWPIKSSRQRRVKRSIRTKPIGMRISRELQISHLQLFTSMIDHHENHFYDYVLAITYQVPRMKCDTPTNVRFSYHYSFAITILYMYINNHKGIQVQIDNPVPFSH